jgi:hypothetical protein
MTYAKCHSLITLSLVLVAACGSGSGPDPGGGPSAGTPDAGSDPVPPPDPGEDYVFPDVAHTGFDGTHAFKVPLSTNLTDVTWTVGDESIADVTGVPAPAELAEYGETWAVVTTRKAGTTMVTATAGGKTVSAMLVVEAYDAASVTAGEGRYNSPDNPGATQRNACVSCHGLPNGVDHSPVQMAYFADDEILSAITTGMYPDGYVLTGVNHAWNLTDGERKGIVPYLRSLPLKGF